MSSGRLEGRTAIVTGAAGGLGRSHAHHLARDGASLVLVDLAPADDLVAEIEQKGGRATAYVADLSSEAAVAELAEKVLGDHEQCDILVNNAGILPGGYFMDVDFAAWKRVMSVNVDSVFLMSKAFAPGMCDRRWGRIINIASDTIGLALPWIGHYIASKMAVVGLTRGMATDLGPYGITVNAIGPGLVKTPGTAEMPPEQFDAVAAQTALKRGCEPADVSRVVAFLASDEAEYMTGQTLMVDGGMVRL